MMDVQACHRLEAVSGLRVSDMQSAINIPTNWFDQSIRPAPRFALAEPRSGFGLNELLDITRRGFTALVTA